MFKLIATVRRTPGILVDLASWAWHHPTQLAVFGLISLFVGAFVYVSAYFHRK